MEAYLTPLILVWTTLIWVVHRQRISDGAGFDIGFDSDLDITGADLALMMPTC